MISMARALSLTRIKLASTNAERIAAGVSVQKNTEGLGMVSRLPNNIAAKSSAGKKSLNFLNAVMSTYVHNNIATPGATLQMNALCSSSVIVVRDERSFTSFGDGVGAMLESHDGACEQQHNRPSRLSGQPRRCYGALASHLSSATQRSAPTRPTPPMTIGIFVGAVTPDAITVAPSARAAPPPNINACDQSPNGNDLLRIEVTSCSCVSRSTVAHTEDMPATSASVACRPST